MNQKNNALKLIVWMTLIVTISIISSACSTGPKQGHWEGEPSVSFDVTTDGRIRDFRIVIPMGVDKCTITLEKEIDVETDGTFIIGEIDSEGLLEGNSISGEFDSADTVIGAYSKTWLCGSQFSFSSAEGSWSAEWKE